MIALPILRFQPGERVRVVRGPLVDHIGICEGMSAKDRVAVLFTMFNSPMAINVRERDLISA